MTATSDLALKATALRILAEPKTDHEDADSIRIRAAAALLTGNASNASELLRDQLKRTPQRADLWNDLAASLYQAGNQADDPSAIAAALSAVDHALALSASLAEAVFNRGTILDSLSLREAAAKSWQTYLRLDNTSAWAAEAREALARDRRPTAAEQWKAVIPMMERAIRDRDLAHVDSVVDAYPQQIRTWGEGEYLCRWAEEHLAGRVQESEAALLLARVLGERLAVRKGETLLRSAVNAIDHQPPDGIANLARGYVAYKRARILIKDRKPSEAEVLLTETEGRFAASKSPMELVARYYHAGVAFDARDAQRALKYLASVDEALRPGFDALRAQVLWERARILGRRGDLYADLTAASAATRIFDRLGETENRTRVAIETAVMLFELGRPEEGWRTWRAIFGGASETGSPGLLQLALQTAAASEIRDGNLDVARALLGPALESSGASPLVTFNAQLSRAFVAQRMGENIQPLSSLHAASQRIGDPALAEEANDRLRFFEALIVGDADPARAIGLLDDAIAFRKHTRRLSRLADAQLERARAFQRLGRMGEAIADLNAALDTLEVQRNDVQGEDLRDSFFATAEDVCDELVSLHQSREESDLAFAAVDRCRSRAISDLVAGVTPQHGTIDEIQRHLAPKTAVVVYAPLREHLLAWVVTADKRDAFVVPVSRDDLQHWAGEIHRAVRSGDSAAFDAATHRLSAVLIAPIEARFELPEHLVIVPDTIIAGVPMAALVDRRGRALIATTEIVIAPNASGLLRERRPFGRPATSLVIGDPQFSVDSSHPLERLPAAGEEARSIAALYHNALLLTDDQATSARFLEAAPMSDMIHVGAHAVLSARDARDSEILLAPSPAESGALTLKQITSLRMRPGSIVVLAGCKTAAFGGGRGSIRSLAYAFLAAGSRAAVASLWDSEDETSRVFSTGFHRRMRDGLSPAAALVETQREMSQSTNGRIHDPRSWAAFQLYAVD